MNGGIMMRVENMSYQGSRVRFHIHCVVKW